MDEHDDDANDAGGMRSAATASGVYFGAQALLIGASLISMPILTRLLSTAEYGLAADPRSSETTGAMEAASRHRLLMIVRDYPPANTPAALRALGFARYLPEFGWDASVVIVRAGFHSSSDSSLLRQVPREGCGLANAASGPPTLRFGSTGRALARAAGRAAGGFFPRVSSSFDLSARRRRDAPLRDRPQSFSLRRIAVASLRSFRK